MGDSRKAYYDDTDNYERLCDKHKVKKLTGCYGWHAQWVEAYDRGETLQTQEEFEAEFKLKEVSGKINRLEEQLKELNTEASQWREKLQAYQQCR